MESKEEKRERRPLERVEHERTALARAERLESREGGDLQQIHWRENTGIERDFHSVVI